MAGLYTVREDYHWLGIGLLLLALGSIFFELASVSYNAMLVQVATPSTIGRVSGFGWSMGYFGGIVQLLGVYVLLIAGDGGCPARSHRGRVQHPAGGARRRGVVRRVRDPAAPWRCPSCRR